MPWLVVALVVACWLVTIAMMLRGYQHLERSFARERHGFEAERRALEAERRDLTNRLMYMVQRPWEGPPVEGPASNTQPDDAYEGFVYPTDIVGVTD